VLVVGGDDQVWPALPQAQAIMARRAEHGLDTMLVSDPEAGHRTILPGEPVLTGACACGAVARRSPTAGSAPPPGRTSWSCESDPAPAAAAA
jgi:hypothetical protein